MLNSVKTFAKIHFGLWLLICVAFSMSACSTIWAGGVDEEQNTVTADADNLDDGDSSSSSVEKISATSSAVEAISSTSRIVHADGEMDGIDHSPEVPSTSSTLSSAVYILISSSSVAEEKPSTSTFKGLLMNQESSSLSLTLDVDGSSFNVNTDASGYFTLEDLPYGTFPMYVLNEDGSTTDVAFFVQNEDSKSLLGPIPASLLDKITCSDLTPTPTKTIIVGNPQDPPFSDSTLNGGGADLNPHPKDSVSFYNDVASRPVANYMPSALDYGVVCNFETPLLSEKNYSCDISNTPKAVFVEAIAVIDALDGNGTYRKNMVGMANDNYNGLFRLAVINNECGATKPSLAFFVSDGFGFSCNNAVVSDAEIELNEPMQLTAIWYGDTLKLYKNGFLIAFRVAVDLPSNVANAPVVFGDQNLDLKLDEVRLGNLTITAADVLYRYYLKGGAQ